MTERTSTPYTPDSVTPPGQTLRDILEERGVTQAELATRMGRPRKTISEIITGKAAITHETALQLELVTGAPASFWNARERAYRAHLAALEERRRLEREAKWCTRFPLAAMRKLGWLAGPKEKSAMVREVFSFLEVVSSDQWGALYAEREVAFRMSPSFSPDPYALGAWLRRGALEARTLGTQPFDRDRFLQFLGDARALTRAEPKVFVPALTKGCAAAGVAVVLVPELPRSRAAGATRWVAPEKALIQLSLRYKTNDHLWFTFFHEAAHVLLHGKKQFFIEGGAEGESKEEREANEWAANWLIPRADFSELTSASQLSESAIVAFARRVGIAPGIVVGRLQHEKLILHSRLNHLKVRYSWGAKPAVGQGAASS